MNVISNSAEKQISWSTVVMLTLGFWLSGSLLLDSVIIPGLSASGMMSLGGVASAGYLIFGIFNHIELLCAALVLTGFLVFYRHHNFTHQKEVWSVILSGLMLVIALVYTYILTPQMGGLGLELNLFEPTTTMPAAMVSLHQVYWVLEAIKLLAGVTLLSWCYRNACRLV
ncbi:MAG: hypothetical protein DSM107014_15800 [Gomphosphaeria aponina SAG 52.96 = DSM 107014]|uniref:DUF4149 domain-containing protein n=1 Tax=Gomphosphaeria aponina SAG 52.96 = DSM 107014 TaxID=1521640 RepID=A0A941GV80_9CHRO|nr:hypothetical protein [Gomphosphaeria aponina SAG 52.96 = DSM 107014]